MENILEKIEEIRKEKGIKQEVLAECLEVKQPAYANSIRREKDIRWSELLQLCNALDMDVILGSNPNRVTSLGNQSFTAGFRVLAAQDLHKITDVSQPFRTSEKEKKKCL